MSKVPTVRIEAEGGFIVINESDYDSETMKITTAKKERTTSPAPEVVLVEDVLAAMKGLDEDDNNLWTDQGIAKTTALSDILGKVVSAKLRDEATDLLEKE